MQLERLARRIEILRQGPDHRAGEQVTFLDVKQHFGLGHVRVGRWVSSEESLIAANMVFDSLADLALVLNLPSHALGLSERLNLAYGHGGREGVMAHYAPAERTLALTKHAGAGALAHEYWHALDHHLADTAFARVGEGAVIPLLQNGKTSPNVDAMLHGNSSQYAFASQKWLIDCPLKVHPLNEKLHSLFASVLLSDDGEQAHYYVMSGIELDRRFGLRYFSHPSELMARAFEAVIERCARYESIDIESGEIHHLPLINPYLVSGSAVSQAHHGNIGDFQRSKAAEWGQMPAGAFPAPAHLDEIAPHLFGYFHALAKALSIKQHLARG